MKSVKIRNKYFGRIFKGEEIITSIVAFCKENEIRNGHITAIGAAEKLKLGFYDTSEKKYLYKDFDGDYEITSLTGNITLLDGNPFPHIHIHISDRNFKTWGGHLVSGTVSVTCEFVIENFDTSVSRKPDPETGLNLISFEE